MPEPRRHPQHVMVVGGQFRAHPATKGRRAAPQVHRHVEHGTRDDPHQLSLRFGQLVVQTAQDMLFGAVLIVLNEFKMQPRVGKLALGPGLEEMAAGILEDLRLMSTTSGMAVGSNSIPHILLQDLEQIAATGLPQWLVTDRQQLLAHPQRDPV